MPNGVRLRGGLESVVILLIARASTQRGEAGSLVKRNSKADSSEAKQKRTHLAIERVCSTQESQQ